MLAEVIGRSQPAHSRGVRSEIPCEVPAHFDAWLRDCHVGNPLYDAKSLFRAVQKRRGILTGVLRLYDEWVMDCIRDARPPFAMLR
ncbi:hypothetical protein [Microvirga makkahensis]|uniref:hypothetical protein n=1 Tax=Microvirga makkahensis TaxID=1128670 RepID=UPI00197C0EEA|nr:hypothetical protein [Microvirga makkahensis]